MHLHMKTEVEIRLDNSEVPIGIPRNFEKMGLTLQMVLMELY